MNIPFLHALLHKHCSNAEQTIYIPVGADGGAVMQRQQSGIGTANLKKENFYRSSTDSQLGVKEGVFQAVVVTCSVWRASLALVEGSEQERKRLELFSTLQLQFDSLHQLLHVGCWLFIFLFIYFPPGLW